MGLEPVWSHLAVTYDHTSNSFVLYRNGRPTVLGVSKNPVFNGQQTEVEFGGFNRASHHRIMHGPLCQGELAGRPHRREGTLSPGDCRHHDGETMCSIFPPKGQNIFFHPLSEKGGITNKKKHADAGPCVGLAPCPIEGLWQAGVVEHPGT